MQGKNSIVIAGFLGGLLGVGSYFFFTDISLGWLFVWSIYWGFFSALLAKIFECIIYKNPMIAKLGSYFQSWGAVGTFIGLIIMTSKIGDCLGGGETSAIKEQLAGFSTCFLTSLVGVCFAILTSVIADFLGLEE